MAEIMALLAAICFAAGTVLQQAGTLQTPGGMDDPSSSCRSCGARSGWPAGCCRAGGGSCRPRPSTGGRWCWSSRFGPRLSSPCPSACGSPTSGWAGARSWARGPSWSASSCSSCVAQPSTGNSRTRGRGMVGRRPPRDGGHRGPHGPGLERDRGAPGPPVRIGGRLHVRLPGRGDQGLRGRPPPRARSDPLLVDHLCPDHLGRPRLHVRAGARPSRRACWRRPWRRAMP